MREWLDAYLPYLAPIFIIGSWLLVIYLIALTGGWRLLAQRFRAAGKIQGRRWSMQSASMRWMTRYNNGLTIGADETGLYIVPTLLFRMGHPPLYIPWMEITAQDKTEFFFLKSVELRLGRSEQVPFRISAKLAAEIQAAAGPGWPTGYEQAMAAPPPPIG